MDGNMRGIGNEELTNKSLEIGVWNLEIHLELRADTEPYDIGII